MSYTAWSVVFGEQPSASKWNILGTNDASFNDGTGIADLAILTRHLQAGGAGTGVTGAKLSTAVKAINNRSTSEVATDFTWVDGKTIYTKTVSVGTLPNATSKNVAHGITYDTILDYFGTGNTGVGGTTIGIPFVGSGASYMECYITSTNIVITSASNRSSYTGYVTILYTKP